MGISQRLLWEESRKLLTCKDKYLICRMSLESVYGRPLPWRLAYVHLRTELCTGFARTVRGPTKNKDLAVVAAIGAEDFEDYKMRARPIPASPRQ